MQRRNTAPFFFRLVLASLSSWSAARADGWIGTVGARLSVYPPYEGAGHDVIIPSPTFHVRRADAPDRFVPPDAGISLGLFSNRYLVLGPVVRFRLSRGDTGKLTGMDKIGWAAEPGLFAEFWPTNWFRARVEGRRGVFGHDGWVGDGALDLIYTGRKWSASLGPRIGYGDSHYTDTYFGVTPAEAARSPFIKTPYEPGGGQRYLGLEAAVAHHFSARWVATADFGYHRLASLASRSPLVQAAGSPNDLSTSLTLSYSFGLRK